MPFPFFQNAMESGMLPQPDVEYNQNQQAFYDQQWDNTSARIVVEEQVDIGSHEFESVEVWINKAIGNTTTFMKNGEDYRQLIFRDIQHQIHRGIYFKFEDNWWISDFTNPSQGLVADVNVRRCNNALRVVDPENGSIFSAPCVVDYDATSPSVQVSSSIITPNNHLLVYVQANDDTIRLFKLNTRFLIGGRAFKLFAFQNALLQSVDDPVPTILYLDLYLDELHAEDNQELGLAYNGDFLYTIEIESANMSLVTGSTGKLFASVSLNGEGVEKSVVWSSSDETVVTINQNGEYQVLGEAGQQAIINAALEGNASITDGIAIHVVAAEEVQPVIALSPAIDKIRQYQTIEAEVYVAVSGMTFEPGTVTATGSNEYFTVSVEGNNLILHCLNYSTEPQTFTLHCVNETPTFNVTQSFTIRCVSMFG